MKATKFTSKVLLGKVDNENIYLSPPSWNCSWYWGFGYLGNKGCYYHVDGLNRYENINLFDAFKKHFDKGTFIVKSDKDLWTLCELFETFYTLKETAEVLGRGGSYYTTNPCKDLIVNQDEVNRINEVILPAIFDEIYLILERSQELPKVYNELVKMNNKGNTAKVVDFMNEHKIHTDDLRNIEGITEHDFDIIHSAYWSAFHANK